MLDMKEACERCGSSLEALGHARVCSFECTFCQACAHEMHHTCPNCAGELVPRPRRGASPASIAEQDLDSAATELLHQSMPFTKVLGLEVLRADRLHVSTRLQWSPERCTSGGALHGGMLMAAADATGGLCAFLNLPSGAAGTTTIESKTNLLRAVRSGAAGVDAEPLHVGRTTIVVETTIRDEGGRVVSKTTQTQAVLAPHSTS